MPSIISEKLILSRKKNLSEIDSIVYYQLKEVRLSTESDNHRSSFNISISLKNKKTGETESTEVNDVTSLKNIAMDIFISLINGNVTPVSLYDIIEDFL